MIANIPDICLCRWVKDVWTRTLKASACSNKGNAHPNTQCCEYGGQDYHPPPDGCSPPLFRHDSDLAILVILNRLFYYFFSDTSAATYSPIWLYIFRKRLPFSVVL